MASRSQRKLWRALGRRKGRAEHGLFLAEGPRLLEELLESPLSVVSVLHTEEALRDARVQAAAARAAGSGVEVMELGEREFGEFADTATPQGVLAVARIPEPDWPDVGSARILLLDGVQDPGNLGTLVRTAEALGLGGVVCLPGTVDPWNPKAVRAAAGSAFRVPLLYRARGEALDRIGALGAALWAADPTGEPFSRGDRAPTRLALALGNEARGVSGPVLEAADRRVSVPMAGRVESLNVAVAGAILMDRTFEAPAGGGESNGRVGPAGPGDSAGGSGLAGEGAPSPEGPAREREGR